MRHRGSSKIKYEHHMIKGLRQLLEKIEPWGEIKTIIPGRIEPIKYNKPLSINVQYNTLTGVKCIVRSGTAVQEVFIITPNPDAFKRRLEGFFKNLEH